MSNQLTGGHGDNRLALARRRRARRDMIRQRNYTFQQLGYWISMEIFTARWRTVNGTMSDPSSGKEE